MYRVGREPDAREALRENKESGFGKGDHPQNGTHAPFANTATWRPQICAFDTSTRQLSKGLLSTGRARGRGRGRGRASVRVIPEPYVIP